MKLRDTFAFWKESKLPGKSVFRFGNEYYRSGCCGGCPDYLHMNRGLHKIITVTHGRKLHVSFSPDRSANQLAGGYVRFLIILASSRLLM